jgi:DNA (cytosine-5)-methyltransferase 1
MLKVLDTFAGAGGFSLGFQLTQQCEIIGAIEIDEWAGDTFKTNHENSKVLIGDIQLLSEQQLKKEFTTDSPDIILGGPPCQGFSICRQNAGDPKNPKNSLFTEFIRLGEIFSPKLMVMENVPNLINAKTSDNTPVISIIRGELEKLGYYVYHSVLDATDYGVPQIRRRLFVIASKVRLETPFPKPSHAVCYEGNSVVGDYLEKCPTLWEAISDLPDIGASQGSDIMQYDKPPLNDYQILMRIGSNELHNHIAMKHSKRVIVRFAAMSWGDSVSDVANEFKPIKRNGNGQISEKTYDQNNRRMYPYKPCHTIAASFYANFVHPFKNRNFTPREGARIQSFPDWYIFKGKPTVVSHKLLQREGRLSEKHLCQYNQIGNAVPPLMAKAIAQNLIVQL